MSVYSARLLTIRIGTSSGSPYYSDTVGENDVWVIRCITPLIDLAGSGTADMWIDLDGENQATIGSWTVTDAPGITALGVQDCRVVLNPGERIGMLFTDGEWDFTVSGYVLSNYS